MNFQYPSETILSDYSDFGDEIVALMATEAAGIDTICEDHFGEIKLIDAIDAALNGSNGLEVATEYPPGHIGGLPGYSRTSAIKAVETLVMAAVGRRPSANRIKSPLIGPLLHHVALWSDNSFGSCTHGARRIGEYLGCSERYCRALITQSISEGLLRCEVRPGQTPALWLPYSQSVLALSAIQISKAIAPPAAQPGRPPAAEKPRKSCVPEIGADRVKTPEVIRENPGTAIEKPRNYSGSATKNSSLKELVKRKGEEEGEQAPQASPDLSGSEVPSGSTGADYLWEALEGQGVQRTKSHNIRAMRQTMAACEWIGRLSLAEAQQLASVCASSETFWPRTAVLSECARKYFEKIQLIDEDRQRYRSEMKAYEDFQNRIIEAEAAAAKIAAEFPQTDETADWRAEHERRKSIEEAQAAAGIDVRLIDHYNRPVMIKPHEPLDTEVRFAWPKTASKLSRWQA